MLLFLAASPAHAFDLKHFEFKDFDNPLIQVFLLISFLSLLPAVLIMFTSFTRIVIVLSLVRHALGGQNIPPNPVIIGLSMFLTFFVMSPTINTITKDAIAPYMDEDITFGESLEKAAPPIKAFMLKQTRQKDLALFIKLAKEAVPKTPEELPLNIIVPAFAISELKTAFEMGFLIFLPFLVIDMVVASILLSMGMMMLPPVMISLPFKLILFVLADGWNLIVGSMMRSFQ
ncbi:MAG: flagellar type III secretion system pore protein FliP [Nitrospirae bacterium]|nr:flagellar type III secretion system pore protein FliP [Nitrospirota bacterium]